MLSVRPSKEGLVEASADADNTDWSATVGDIEIIAHQDWTSHPQNPMNWSALRKYSVVLLLSITSIIASVCSTAFEPALPIMMQDFHSSSDSLSSLFITVYLLGYVLGPLLIAPTSELYGRTFVLWAAYLLFMVTLVICATATTLTTFIVIRCFMGFAANAFVIVGPAIVADIIPTEQRGLALSVVSSGSILGPTLGPCIGGFIIQAVGWRWIFWITLIIFGALSMISLFILRETYPLVLQGQHRQPLSSNLRSRFLPIPRLASQKSPRAVLLAAFTRPPKLFFLSPIIPLLALYTSVSYMYLNVLFATLGTIFETRDDFRPWASGLTYLGMTAGFAIALISTGLFADRFAKWLATRRANKISAQRPQDAEYTPRRDNTPQITENGTLSNTSALSQPAAPSPETRLPLAILGSVLIIPAILMYGFTLESPVHWIVPLIATTPIACAAVWSFMAAQMYLVDAYGIFSASATGAVSIFRSICAAVVPLAANPAYDRWGYGWGNAVFALACVPFVPLVIGLMVWGPTLRGRFVIEL